MRLGLIEGCLMNRMSLLLHQTVDRTRARLFLDCCPVVDPSTLEKELVYSSGITAIESRPVVKQSS